MKSERARHCPDCRGARKGCPTCNGTGFVFEAVALEEATAFHAPKSDGYSLPMVLLGVAALLALTATAGLLSWWWTLIPLGAVALIYIAVGAVLIAAIREDLIDEAESD